MLGFGPIHAKGKDKVLGPRKDRFVFPNGTVLLRHKPSAPGQDTFDEKTCYFKFVERGTWRVTDGTGAYNGASGHGRYRVRGRCRVHRDKPPRISCSRSWREGRCTSEPKVGFGERARATTSSRMVACTVEALTIPRP